MANSNRICLLKPVEAEDRIIQLEPGRNTIGRSRESGIRDVRCSKEQLLLNVDMNICNIEMKVLGLNPCGVNGLMAMQHTKCTLQHGDILELVYGRHAFKVTFKPPPSSEPEPPVQTKVEQELKAPESDAWQEVSNGELLIFSSAGVRASSKIAGYDMDWTIIKTRSGNVFPKNNDDWELMYSQVPRKLKRLHDDGYKICFFTNQGGIGKGKTTMQEFKSKIKAVQQCLGVPLQVFAATGRGYYRKPLPGMWEQLRDVMNDGLPVQLEKCFYVGDAAGRAESGKGASKRRKDHSLVDRLFAENVGVPFYTPEAHFLDLAEEPWTKPTFVPSSLNNNAPLLEPADAALPAQSCELIVMVGLPGSGKSYFCHEHLAPHDYVIVNADTLGGVPACLKLCEKTLASGKSCVVDNTNVTAEARSKFSKIAQQLGVPCRCFVMNVSHEHIKHNIVFRELIDFKHSKINDMVFNGMKKRYAAPTCDEGFAAIVQVNWQPKFKETKHEQLYKLYLLEK